MDIERPSGVWFEAELVELVDFLDSVVLLCYVGLAIIHVIHSFPYHHRTITIGNNNPHIVIMRLNIPSCPMRLMHVV